MHQTKPTALCKHKRHRVTCVRCHPNLNPANRPQIRGLLPFVLRAFQEPFDQLLERDEITLPRTMVPGLETQRKVAVLKKCAWILGFQITVEPLGLTDLRVTKRSYDYSHAVVFV